MSKIKIALAVFLLSGSCNIMNGMARQLMSGLGSAAAGAAAMGAAAFSDSSNRNSQANNNQGARVMSDVLRNNSNSVKYELPDQNQTSTCRKK